ncbi:MAG TPA: DUF4350 domain-containing protein [Chloroflexota bacterium]|nr:DUF4350 domain-containing protein [Chloroflexota bacterium]
MSGVGERLRRLAPLLVLFAVALLLAWLGARRGASLPAGSSRSAAPDGARALYLWTDAIGRRAQRVESAAALRAARPAAVLVLAPVVPLDAAARAVLDAVPAGGGTLVLAGPTAAYGGYLESLGISAASGTLAREARTPGGLAVRVDSRERLEGEGTTPLLTAPDGEAVAVGKARGPGRVVVVTGLLPFTNAGLQDDDTARFVYRLLDESVPPGAVAAFDESHYQEVTAAGEPVQTFDALLRGTAPGRAALYAAVVAFGYLLLSGRRLGPPLPPVGATAPSRTMFEQVQALAGLYRRSGQVGAARSHFVEHYGRVLASRRLPPAQEGAARAALSQIEAARGEGALTEAVDRMEAALAPPAASAPVP